MLTGRTGQDDRQAINSEVQLVFRKKTRGQVIGAELQEGFTHLGVAASQAGRLAAEQVSPRVAAAREAATPAYEAAKFADRSVRACVSQSRKACRVLELGRPC